MGRCAVIKQKYIEANELVRPLGRLRMQNCDLSQLLS
jgi:hypothetical protein